MKKLKLFIIICFIIILILFIACEKSSDVKSDLDKYEEAISDFTKAIELNQEYAYAYNNRGYAYYNLGKNEEAISDLTKAIELNPDFELAKKNLKILKDYIEESKKYINKLK